MYVAPRIWVITYILMFCICTSVTHPLFLMRPFWQTQGKPGAALQARDYIIH